MRSLVELRLRRYFNSIKVQLEPPVATTKDYPYLISIP